MEQKQDEAVCPTYQTLCLQFLIMALYAVCIKKTKRIKGKKKKKTMFVMHLLWLF